jgi:hypothetical protein
MDQGIWATWYDLEAEDRDAFVQWMHEHYLPSLKMRPGFAWVAHYQSEGGGPAMRQVRDTLIVRPDDDIGSGSQYLMLAGAPSPHTFLNPSVLEIEREQSADVRAMLAKRRGVRTAIFSEERRVDGPAARERPPGTTPGPAIQMGSFRVRTIEEEFDLGCWYAQYRLPHMAQMPGSIASRKLICVAGWAKHAVMYEFTSLEARLANFEEPHESHALDPKEWTGRVVRYTVHAPGSPTVGVRIWPPVKSSGK